LDSRPSDSRLSIQDLAINGQALGWIVAGLKRGTGFISGRKQAETPLFMAHSGAPFKPIFWPCPHRVMMREAEDDNGRDVQMFRNARLPSHPLGCGGA
jgi:hypothetical protein